MSLFFNLDYLKSYIWGPSAMRRRWARIYALWGSKSAHLVPKKCSKSPQKAFKKRLKNKAWKKKIQNENCPFMTFEKKEGLRSIRPSYQPTGTTSYRDARTHLKRYKKKKIFSQMQQRQKWNASSGENEERKIRVCVCVRAYVRVCVCACLCVCTRECLRLYDIFREYLCDSRLIGVNNTPKSSKWVYTLIYVKIPVDIIVNGSNYGNRKLRGSFCIITTPNSSFGIIKTIF